MKTIYRYTALIMMTVFILSFSCYAANPADEGAALPANMIRVGLYYGIETIEVLK